MTPGEIAVFHAIAVILELIVAGLAFVGAVLALFAFGPAFLDWLRRRLWGDE
jgi:hypothetical protein